MFFSIVPEAWSSRQKRSHPWRQHHYSALQLCPPGKRTSHRPAKAHLSELRLCTETSHSQNAVPSHRTETLHRDFPLSKCSPISQNWDFAPRLPTLKMQSHLTELRLCTETSHSQNAVSSHRTETLHRDFPLSKCSLISQNWDFAMRLSTLKMQSHLTELRLCTETSHSQNAVSSHRTETLQWDFPLSKCSLISQNWDFAPRLPTLRMQSHLTETRQRLRMKLHTILLFRMSKKYEYVSKHSCLREWAKASWMPHYILWHIKVCELDPMLWTKQTEGQCSNQSSERI